MLWVLTGYRENRKPKMKKAITLILAGIICLLCFAGCCPYKSSYKAVAFVHSNTDDSAKMNFSEFEGTIVFELKSQNGSQAKLKYSAKLQKGNAQIYYDHDGTKKKLFSAREGEQERGFVKGLTNEKVYIIVETNGKCEDGEMSFEVD